MGLFLFLPQEFWRSSVELCRAALREFSILWVLLQSLWGGKLQGECRSHESVTGLSVKSLLSSHPLCAPLLHNLPSFLFSTLFFSSSCFLCSFPFFFPFLSSALLFNLIKALIGLIYSDCSLVEDASLRTVMYRAQRRERGEEEKKERQTEM